MRRADIIIDGKTAYYVDLAAKGGRDYVGKPAKVLPIEPQEVRAGSIRYDRTVTAMLCKVLAYGRPGSPERAPVPGRVGLNADAIDATLADGTVTLAIVPPAAFKGTWSEAVVDARVRQERKRTAERRAAAAEAWWDEVRPVVEDAVGGVRIHVPDRPVWGLRIGAAQIVDVLRSLGERFASDPEFAARLVALPAAPERTGVEGGVSRP